MSLIRVDSNFYLDTEEGLLVNKSLVKESLKKQFLQKRNVVISDNIEINPTVDTKIIELGLYSNSGKIQNNQGFLVEVFLSGTEGQLTKLYRKETTDIEEGIQKSDSYMNYLELIVD